MDGLLEAVPVAERLDELRPACPSRRRAESAGCGVVEVEDAFVLIFLQQRFEHGAGLRAVFGEHVALA